MSMTDTSTGPDFSTGSASSLVADYLNSIGLGSLSQAAWQQWNALPDSAAKQGEFMLWLRGTPEYKARFPYADDLRKQGVPFTEAGAISYENQARQLLSSVGAPKEFVTQDLLNKLIGGNISFNELEQRVVGGLGDYENAPEIVKQEFRNQLGDDSALIGFFLDPAHTMQEFDRIKAGAEVRGYGKQFGLDINLADAQQIGLGMSAQEIQQHAAQAGQLGALGRGTVADQTPFTDTKLASDVFTGNTGAINKKLDERAAEFSDASGGYSAGAQTGFGAAKGA